MRSILVVSEDKEVIGTIQACFDSKNIITQASSKDDALKTLDEGILEAQQTTYRSMLWRLYACRSKVRTALGDQNGAEEDNRLAASIIKDLANTIPDQELRQGFEIGSNQV